MSNLIIVESPTKAKTLSRFLGSDYRIEATMGHIRDLPEKKLGLEIKSKNNEKDSREQYEFTPDYQIIAGRKQRVAEINKLANDANKIILATDPDREGEAIAYHIGDVIGSSSKFKVQSSKLERIVFHEITESAIKEALLHPRTIDMQLVDAQQGRRILDRLVGYKLSPLLWNKLGKRWLSAGRVQSVAVRLIVEREREIEAFEPLEYWLIDAELEKTDNAKQSFFARLFEIEGKKAEIKDKEIANKIVEALKLALYKVANIEEKEVRRYSSPPFTTSTMQQTASNRFGWSAKKTMRAAQMLYEEGLITYHRTDSTNLAVAAISMVRDYINNVYGRQYLPPSPRVYKTKSKVAQEAHEAIRPTNVKVTPENFSQNLGRDAYLLYSLVWKRFAACQMCEAIFTETNVDVLAQREAQEYLLKAKGEKLKFAGWMAVYDRNQKSKIKNQKEENENDEEKKELPILTIGEILKLLQILPQQKFTQPPPRYTEATLIKTLEEQGIGRPSTYAPIISTIQDRKYVEKIERKFKPTDLGFAVTDFLVKYFPDIFAISFTAKMEDELDEIANGNRQWNSVISNFYAPFSQKLSQVFKTAGRVKVDLGTTDEKCPQCGQPLVIRLSKYGKFLACSGFPKCKFTKNIIEKIEIPCPKCGGDIVVKRTKRGKQFYGCGNYPKCTFAAWKKEEIK